MSQNTGALTAFDFFAGTLTPGLLAARLRKLPALRVAAINRWQQAEVFGLGKEVASV